MNNPLDLNTAESSLSQPLELTANRTVLGLLCCPRGKATMKARISKRGFVCGERLPITVEIVNGTTKTVGDTSVTLERIVECIGCHIAKGDSKMEVGFVCRLQQLIFRHAYFIEFSLALRVSAWLRLAPCRQEEMGSMNFRASEFHPCRLRSSMDASLSTLSTNLR